MKNELELINVKKSYGNFDAIHGINLKISEGSYCCLLGPSGCGKTSLLRMIAGHEEITLGAYKAATAAAVVPVPNLSIFLLEIDDEFLDFIFSSVVKNM